MNKFRARQLDASKPIPIYKAEELSDSIEINNATNRTVPQMPTGMEKEEETEHHLQEAIIHQRVIPVPEYYDTTSSDYGLKAYDSLYPPNYKPTKQMIHILPFSADQDIPDYDMDTEDEVWISGQMDKGELSIDPLHFEEMMDRLEKSSGLKAVTLQDAKVLLKDDDDLITAVYDYWLNKRLRLQHPLILSVKSEKGVGAAQSDPYVAFRKRTEKMQTRKNRKNDESSYEKMLKLRRDLSRAVTLLEMVKRREKSKRELLHITLEIFEKRYELEDFTGALLNELNMTRVQRPAFSPLTQNQPNCTSLSAPVGTGAVPGTWPKVPAAAHPNKGNRRREDRKREGRHHRNRRRHHAHLSSSSTPTPTPVVPTYSHLPDPYVIASSYPQGQSGYVPALEEEVASRSQSEAEDENPDGVFTFKRKKYISYHAPREGDWPWVTPSKGGGGDPRFRFSLTSLSHPVRQCVGFARRRVGRGGRVWIDRIGTSVDDAWLKTDFKENSSTADEFLKEIRTEWPHYYPSSPREDPDTDIEIDVESVTVPVTFPPDVTLTTTTAASSDELNLAAAMPPSVIITAEVLEGSEQGSVTDLEVSVPSVLDTLLSTDSGVLLGENLQMDLLSSETPTTASAGGSGIKVVTSVCSVQSSSCVSDSVNISAVSSSVTATENCSEKDWPLSSAISNAGNSSSTSHRQQHSIDFTTQPSSKFVTLDCTNSLPLAVSGLQLSTSNVTGDALHSSSPLSLSSSSSSSSSPSSSASHCPVVSSSHHTSTFSSSTVSYSSLALSKLSTSTALSSSMSLSTWSTSASLSKTLSGASPHLTFEKDCSENAVSAVCSSNRSTLVTSVNMQSHQKDSLVDNLSVPSGYVIPNNKNGSSAANNTVYLKRRKTLDTNDTFVDDNNGTSLSNGPNSSIEKARCAKVENCVFNETGFV